MNVRLQPGVPAAAAPVRLIYPDKFGGARGPGFWANPANWLAARKKFRRDYSVDWRRRYEQETPSDPARSTDYRALTGRGDLSQSFSFLILGDTGEGDRSQYGLLPLIRGLNPDFMIINGDVAYPAGRVEDFREGFFEPYQNLGIPVWAVPGNHEYYSRQNGREFFEIFCTDNQKSLWQQYGLRFVRQPGTYWELSSPECPLVVLGLDTGMTGTLDPNRSWLGLVKSDGDSAQHAWLEWRLSVAQAQGKKALVLFHIPSLVNAGKAGGPKLTVLHGLFSRYSQTISAIVTAHEHSFQAYSPQTFASFVGGMQPGPLYFVSGGGGAFLSPVDFDVNAGTYPVDAVFPDRAQWQQHSSLGSRLASKPKRVDVLDSVFGKVIGSFDVALRDNDAADYHSLTQVNVHVGGPNFVVAEMVPYLLTQVEKLYVNPPTEQVLVRAGEPRPAVAQMQAFAGPPVRLA
jgi:hypothetical protein